MKFKTSRQSCETREWEVMTCPCGNDDLKIVHGQYGYSNYSCKIMCEVCGMTVEHDKDIYTLSPDYVISNAVYKWNNICKRFNQFSERKIMHLIDILIDTELDIPCDYMTLIADESGENWCEKNCKDKDNPTKECWLKYLEVKEKMNDWD